MLVDNYKKLHINWLMISYHKTIKKITSFLSPKEILIGLMIFLVSGIFTYQLYKLHDKNLITSSENVYFQADIGRSYSAMSSRWSFGHYRTKVHPLLSIQTHSPVFFLTKLGLSTFSAIKITVSLIASLWGLCLYCMCRLIGNNRIHATLVTMLGLSSSSAFFWLSVPESYALGSLNIIIALCVMALANHKKLPDTSYIFINVITLSTTITNWMSGILGTLARRNIKETIKICLISLALVTIFWGIQKRYFPDTVFFLGDREEASYIFTPSINRIISLLNTFFFHTVISPTFSIIDHNKDGWPLISFQSALPASSNLTEIAGSLLWLCTLVISIIAFFRLRDHSPLRFTLGLTILGQLFLHLFYGEEIFLYSLHFLPLLLGLVSISLNTKYSKVITLMITLLIPIFFITNLQNFLSITNTAVPPDQEVKNQFILNPQMTLPRGEGHIILANPGSKEGNKSYYEPGGSFSPAGQKYGVSIIVDDTNGKLLTTSDSIPLNQINQSLVWESESQLPAVNAITKDYDATWKKVNLNDWQLELKPNQSNNIITSLMIRSAGPAGGPIRDISWNGQTLTINNKWLVSFKPLPKNIMLHEETTSNSSSNKSSNSVIHSDRGWASAKVTFNQGIKTTATFSKINQDTQGFEPLITQTPLIANLEINLPDKRFNDSLNAQVAHMSMGLVDKETRPGDPLYYPLDWQRDGAYILVALLKTGQLETAHDLSKKFAEEDFYGGFGSEADAPGLSIWALNSVANQIKKKSYDQWIWPHVQRKVSLIEKMLYATTNIEAPHTGNVFTQFAENSDINLISEPAKNGLIVGRMDNHRPVLFVNAISYLGLIEAASLAERLNYKNEAKRWRLEASNIKNAWHDGLKVKDYDDDRTYISAIWPSWVADKDFDLITKSLEERWIERHDQKNQYKSPPLWTYFELAEAHQWLLLGNKERSWATVNWFWNNQSSPGLYTWWEGDGTENFSMGPKNIRSSVKPSAVTPHYWTAAEMTLLQLDMLGYLDKSKDEPVVIIGQGVLDDWLNSDMSVKNLRLENFTIDWFWHDKKMQVIVKGKEFIKVKLGNTFNQSTPINVSFQN
jgi:hypothetical protein